MSLGENIARLRSRQGWSQGELADRLEVSRQSVSKWETDASVPDLDKLMKLSEAFGVTLDNLVRGEAAGAADTADSNVAMPGEQNAAGANIGFYSPGAGDLSSHSAQPTNASARTHALPPVQPAQAAPQPGTHKVAALVLFLFGLAVFLLLLLLEGSAAGVLLAVPFWLCAAVCAVCRKNAGLWCAWVVYLTVTLYLYYASGVSWELVLLTFRYEASWNYLRLAFAWGMLLYALVMMLVTVLRFYRLPLTASKGTAAALAAGWAALLVVRVAGGRLFLYFLPLSGPFWFLYTLFGYLQLAAGVALLCFTARLLHSALQSRRAAR